MATKKKKKKTLKVAFAVYMKNCGDGSASAKFFSNVKLAEKAAERDDERYGEDVSSHEFEIDPETGEILSGVATEVEDDEDA